MRLAGRYELGPRLGRGGFGEVFLGEALGEHGFRRRVAVKVLAEPNAAELALAHRLHDPHIIEVYDVLVEDGQVYLVLELADAGSLGDLRHRSPLGVAASAYVAGEILAALEAAHGAGVVAHRDVTPHNVLLFSDGRVKLADFGIAKAEGVEAPETRAGLVKGKLPYLAPEQVKQEPIDARTDLWSLGVLLFELVAGRRPYGGREASDAETLAEIVQAEAPDLSSLGLPGWFETFLEGLLSPMPLGRWPSAQAARAVLEASHTEWSRGRRELVAALSSSGEETRNVRPTPAPQIVTPAASAPLAPPDPARSRPARAGWAVGLVLLGLVGGLGVGVGFWVGDRRVRPQRLQVRRAVAPLREADAGAAPPSAGTVVPAASEQPSPRPTRRRRRRALGPEFFEPGGTLPVTDNR